ncbi:MAG: hypothetical protein JSS27_16240 [Planctomycetes bacterium]|nr:hypothetical protein [Planctomycetota bacterium]
MSRCLSNLCIETDAAIISAELIIILTVLVIGVCVGVTSIRDAIVTEMADVAQAIANLNQSFGFSGVAGHATASAGSEFIDRADFCDRSNATGTNVQQSKCVVVGGFVHPLGANTDGANSP